MHTYTLHTLCIIHMHIYTYVRSYVYDVYVLHFNALNNYFGCTLRIVFMTVIAMLLKTIPYSYIPGM